MDKNNKYTRVSIITSLILLINIVQILSPEVLNSSALFNLDVFAQKATAVSWLSNCESKTNN